MIGYSEQKIFDMKALDAFHIAERAVAKVEDPGLEIRCHEIVRAVWNVLSGHDIHPVKIRLMDGHYGAIEHSWLMVDSDVLDVYCCGALPQVQLIAPQVRDMPPIKFIYRPSLYPRDDIREDVVEQLTRVMRGA